MIDYKTLYHLLFNACEDAIRAIDKQNFGQAKELLIRAELAAEEAYLQQEDK